MGGLADVGAEPESRSMKVILLYTSGDPLVFLPPYESL